MKLVKVNLPEAENKAGKIVEATKEVVVSIKENKNTIIKVISDTSEAVEDIIEVGVPLYHQIVEFFTSLFQKLPTYIDYHGTKYRLTLQPAEYELPDKVFYMIEPNQEGEPILFATDAVNMPDAKSEMRKLLKEKGYLG